MQQILQYAIEHKWLLAIITFLVISLAKNFLYVVFKILTRSKERSYKDFTETELTSGYQFMWAQIENNVLDPDLKNKLFVLLDKRWHQFLTAQFKVDGATFIAEQKGNYFNFWWFNHDARNKFGYVGKAIDNEMLTIMVLLNVPQQHFRAAIWWFKFTWINYTRHLYKKWFKKGTLKNEFPNDLITL